MQLEGGNGGNTAAAINVYLEHLFAVSQAVRTAIM